MYRLRPRPLYSQHFLHNRQLVAQLVRKAGFGFKDTVLEIGPGKGVITRELLETAGRVLAVEIDGQLVKELGRNLTYPGLLLFQDDFLRFPLPHTPYSVFANLPFAIEGDIVRKLLDGNNPPEKMYVVTIKEVGERWVGYGHESLFSMLHKPWFEMKVIHRFKRADFNPQPRIDAIMIKAVKREQPWLPWGDKPAFERFIKQGFGGGKRLDTNLSSVVSKRQLKQMADEIGFWHQARPSELKIDQWIKLFLAIEKLRRK